MKTENKKTKRRRKTITLW